MQIFCAFSFRKISFSKNHKSIIIYIIKSMRKFAQSYNYPSSPELESDSFFSFKSQTTKPKQIPLPITKSDVIEFNIPNIPHNKVLHTLKNVYKIQEASTIRIWPTIIGSILMHILFGLILLYIGILLMIVSLFNIVLFFILIGIEWRYTIWSVRMLRSKRQKKRNLSMKRLLEGENKRFYSKKLIRWVYEQQNNCIIVHNLRFID